LASHCWLRHMQSEMLFKRALARHSADDTKLRHLAWHPSSTRKGQSSPSTASKASNVWSEHCPCIPGDSVHWQSPRQVTRLFWAAHRARRKLTRVSSSRYSSRRSGKTACRDTPQLFWSDSEHCLLVLQRDALLSDAQSAPLASSSPRMPHRSAPQPTPPSEIGAASFAAAHERLAVHNPIGSTSQLALAVQSCSPCSSQFCK